MRTRAAVLGLCVAAAGICSAAAQDDPFAWLEQAESKQALAWVKEHNKVTLDAFKSDERYAKYLSVAEEILKSQDRIPYGMLMGDYIYNFWQDDAHKRGVWRRATVASYASQTPEWETLLDVDALAKAEGENWVFQHGDCSAPGYAKCVVVLSRGGGDAAVVREFDPVAKSFPTDGFKIDEAKTSFSWVGDDSLLVGTNFGDGSLTASGYPRIVKLWTRGTKLTDAKSVFEGKKDDVGVWPMTFAAPEGNKTFISRAVTFFDSETFFVQPDGSTVKLPLPLSAEPKGYYKGYLLVTLRADWTVTLEGESASRTFPQGSLLGVPLSKVLETGKLAGIAAIEVPSARQAIEKVAVSADAVYVTKLDNVRGRVDAWTVDESGEWSNDTVDLPDNGSVYVATANPLSLHVMLNYESFLVPDQLYLASGVGQPLQIIKSLPPRFPAEGFVVEQFEAASKDGTMVPYFVVRKENRPGPVPVMQFGYGGFQVPTAPWYWMSAGRIWLQEGGAYVVANVRGGGEFGPAWHEAARGVNRQRSFDDFIAVSEDLIARGITEPKRLGLIGGSNGGLLVAVAMIQRPDLYNAVLSEVPLLDMLRYTALPPGASWTAEYGDPENPIERKALEAYSPYHNLKDGVVYPKPYFVSSTKDDRVNPAHARKMAALMESKGYPFHFYENIEGGHMAAADLDQKAVMLALQYVYLSRQLLDQPSN
jgi:prolyl oligopeptidase